MRKDAGFRGLGVVLLGTGLFLFSRLGKGEEWWRGWGLGGWDALMLVHTRAYVNRRPCCQSPARLYAGKPCPGLTWKRPIRVRVLPKSVDPAVCRRLGEGGLGRVFFLIVLSCGMFACVT